MNIQEFEAMARLFAIGALEPEELEIFEVERQRLGQQAEALVGEALKISSALVLSLEPVAAQPGRKKKLMRAIQDRPDPH